MSLILPRAPVRSADLPGSIEGLMRSDSNSSRLPCGIRELDLSRAHVMGILNVTPDSFSDGGRYNRLDAALLHVEQMIGAGASLIDVGGESTRPGAAVVSVEEELQRVVPVVEAIAARFDVVISVDTSTPEVMVASAAAGAGLINDVRALERPGALEAARDTGLPICLMHRQGEPDTMQLAPRYASRIVQRRAEAPLRTSAELVEVLIAATPAAVQRAGHPAKRVFQALRIEVNQELVAVERAIPAALDALEVGGRIVVLAYQSLEDRIVKRVLAARSRSTAPRGLPVELPEHRPEFRLLVRGAELAGDDEKARNSRAAPVRLRAAERLRGAA